MKGLSILGSTGSVGTNVLRIVDAFPDRFRVVGLAAGGNVKPRPSRWRAIARGSSRWRRRGALEALARLVDLSGSRVGDRRGGHGRGRDPPRRRDRGRLGGGGGRARAHLPRPGGRQGRGSRQQGDPGDGGGADDGARRGPGARACCPSTASTARSTSASTAGGPRTCGGSCSPPRAVPSAIGRGRPSTRSPARRRSTIPPGPWAARSPSIPPPS